MNALTIIGNITADPQSRTTPDGKSVCNFNVAVNRRTGQKDANGRDVADFFRVSAWGKMGESCQKYLSKGRKVAVRGTVSVHAYTGNDGQAKASMEVFANDVEFLSSGGERSADDDAAHPHMAPQLNPTPVETDELPF